MKTFTLKILCSEIAFREGKKSQARIGDIREILAILSDIFYEESLWISAEPLTQLLIENGQKRYKKINKRITQLIIENGQKRYKKITKRKKNKKK